MILLLVFYWLQCGQQVASYVGDDDQEEDETISRFHEAIWHCDYRAAADPLDSSTQEQPSAPSIGRHP